MKTINTTNLPSQFQKIHEWKVRDTFLREWKRIIIVSDRISAFDYSITTIPYKGQVLNQLSAWWFDKTKDIVPNHIISIPDPNVMIVKSATMFPVEVVVRWYMTWSTDTSIWVNYNKWDRKFCWIDLPDWIKKNEKLEMPIITPTTKPEVWHDLNISKKEIIDQGLVEEEKWNKIEKMAMALYLKWVEVAKERWLIFVDTKYEFWEDEDGNIIVCDEVNTPDSSRYWMLESYKDRLSQWLEPESLDKEFLRLKLRELWYKWDENIPEVSDEFRKEISEKYISLYEKITWEIFVRWDLEDIDGRMLKHLNGHFQKP